jgi:hypothetical protein
MTAKELSETADLSGPARALAKDESTPSGYLEELEKQELYTDAVRFLAYKLPTDAGIKWASACMKELRSPESQKEKDEALEAANAWIKTPGDQTRFAAKEAAGKATKGDSKLLAMAVFMSGGSLAPPGAPETPPPKYSSQKMIAGSVQVTVVSHEPVKANERYKKALKMGKALDGGAGA